MSVEIENLTPNAPDALARRAVTTPYFAARTANRLRKIVGESIRGLDFAPAGACERALEALTQFPDLYETRPVRDNRGGSGYNDSLWIFIIACSLQPEWIVESGVHKGHSTWLFRKACPSARIYSFDIDLGKRIYTDEQATYLEHDWSEWEVPKELDRARSLVFMDDHINQARRLLEIAARGFPIALFDDNFPVEQLHATGGPPVPTISMVLDDGLQNQQEIEWTRNGKAYRFRVDLTEVAQARAAISSFEVFPDLAEVTRYPLGSHPTIVQTARGG